LTELNDQVANQIADLEGYISKTSRDGSAGASTGGAALRESVRKPELSDFEAELMRLISMGNNPEFQELLRTKFLPDAKLAADDIEWLNRLLWQACSSGEIPCIRVLLQYPLDVNYVDDVTGRTCLHEAAAVSADPKEIRVAAGTGLLSLPEYDVTSTALTVLARTPGANLECEDLQGRRPLHYVAMLGSVSSMHTLLGYRVQPNAPDHDGFTPLTYAVIGGHLKCAELLLNAGATVESIPPTAISPMPVSIFQPGNPTFPGTPYSQTSAVISVLHHPLALACQHGHVEIASLLISRFGAGGIVSSTNADGLYPLHLACREGHIELASLLAQAGAAVDARDRYKGWTPVFYAASEGHTECARVLIEHGASISIRDESGWTPWAHALYRGHIETAELLRLTDETISPIMPYQVLQQVKQMEMVPSLDLGASLNVGEAPAAAVGAPSGAAKRQLASPSLSVTGPDSGKSRGGADEDVSMEDAADADEGDWSKKARVEPPPPPRPKAFVPDSLADVPPLGGVPASDSLSLGAKARDEFIPSLALPPPIIPFRIYGHNYLDAKCQIRVTLGVPPAKQTGRPGRRNTHRRPVLHLYKSSHVGIAPSLKLVVTERTDSVGGGSGIPHTVILPQGKERETFMFSTMDPSTFALEFDLYPTFGTKVLGRAVALPCIFCVHGTNEVKSTGQAHVPVFDPKLNLIGEIRFEFAAIKPFRHPKLSIGGSIDTYWKTTKVCFLFSCL
jgi:CDK inhibitor PHO81